MKLKVLYQPYMYHENMKTGPFKYIESGYINGFKKNGYEVKVWDGRNEIDFDRILSSFKPNVFVGYLRGSGDYKNYPWLSIPIFEKLNQFRKMTGLKVALHAHPNVQSLIKHLDLNFVENDPSCAGAFYSQQPPPTIQEQVLVDESFIDVILHSYSSAVTKPCFDYWLSEGIMVLEEPLALDDTNFKPPFFPRIKNLDISYAGGWWPFKGGQMDQYLLPMADNFGSQLQVFGRGWPHLSRGYVNDSKYRKIVWRSKINLVFHEPSQVQGVPVHVNERIYKLYGMRAFALCDNNPCLREYFDDNEVVLCDSPEEMIDKTKYYLKNEKDRLIVAERGHRAVMARHTYSHRAAKLMKKLFN